MRPERFSDAIQFCGDKMEKVMSVYGRLPFAVCMYVAYNDMNPALALEMLTIAKDAEESARKKLDTSANQELVPFITASESFSLTDKGDVIDTDFWMKTIGAVNKCGDELVLIQHEYGDLVFAVNVHLFFTALSEADILTVERLRYINTKLQNNILKIGFSRSGNEQQN